MAAASGVGILPLVPLDPDPFGTHRKPSGNCQWHCLWAKRQPNAWHRSLTCLGIVPLVAWVPEKQYFGLFLTRAFRKKKM